MISHNCKNFNLFLKNDVTFEDILNDFSILSNIIVNKIDNVSGDNTILNKIKDYETIRNINDYSEYKCPLCGKKEVLYFIAKNSVLLIKEVQAENSKKMPVQDFLRGNKVELGEAFE